jgi:hypothetical protein
VYRKTADGTEEGKWITKTIRIKDFDGSKEKEYR